MAIRGLPRFSIQPALVATVPSDVPSDIPSDSPSSLPSSSPSDLPSECKVSNALVKTGDGQTGLVLFVFPTR